MQKLLFFAILLIVSLASCKKNSDPAPNPDLAATIDGTYTMTRIQQGTNTITLPTAGGLSGTVTFTKQFTTQSGIRLILKTGTMTSTDQSFVGYLSGSVANVDIYNEEARTTKVGTATSSSVTFTVIDNGGVTNTIVATR